VVLMHKPDIDRQTIHKAIDERLADMQVDDELKIRILGHI